MFSEFEASLRSAINGAIPSIAYGIVLRDETLLLGAAGLADKDGIQPTPRTPYALASVTKPMSATAVLKLAERGLVNLDAPVDDYLSVRLASRAGDRRDATVRRVLNHTAGLPLYYRFYYADENGSRLPFEETIRRYGKIVSAPGERHGYSNLGYGLLDALIARVSGVTYAEFMANEVFGPLGMTGASIGPNEGAAVGYGPDGVAYPRYVTDHPGGSEAFANVEDLLALGRFHLSDPLEMVREPVFGYGLGWGVTERSDLRIVQHTGSMGGVSTVLRLVPSLGLVIAILTNGQTDLPWRAADEATALFVEGFKASKGVSEPEPRSWPAGLWTGTVEAGDTLPFSLEIGDNGTTLARLDGQESLVEGLCISRGRLVGVFDGDVGTADARRRPYRLHLDLGVRSERLDGAVTAITQVEHPGGAPGHRLGNALSYWVSLERF